MRRHPSLIPLSRFHRSVLFLAQMAKTNGPRFKGYPQEVDGKASYAISFYRTQLIHHIKSEEEILFPAVIGINQEIDVLIEDLKQEHETLNSLFLDIEKVQNLEQHLDQLGFTLEAHVRREERILFQKIQESLSEDALLQLGKLLHNDSPIS